jgi:hypothetical protein
MQTRIWQRFNVGLWLSILLIPVLAIAIAQNGVDRSRGATMRQHDAADVLEGVRLTGSFTDQDIAALREGLQFLRDTVPDWYAFVAEAKPLIISIDLSEGARGLAAKSICCNERGYGSITLGEHLTDMDAPTAQLNQITFLSTLIHEATHIRDRRADRIPAQIDYAACVRSERAAFTQEAEFKRTIVASSTRLNPTDRAALERQIQDEMRALAGTAVNLYCFPLAISSSE